MKILEFAFFAFSSLFLLSSCKEESRNVSLFKGTEAYTLAKEVEQENLKKIEKIIKSDPKLLNITSSSGANVLAMCLYIDKFESFKKLLELGANPNFINPYSKESVLIQACKPFGNQSEWKTNNSYAELLLKYGADPNYSIEEDFKDKWGHFHVAATALMKASSLNLELTKLLLKNGANPNKRLGSKQLTAFGEAVESSKYDIINYYIDSIKVDVHQPLYIRSKDSLFIQDYVVNKFTLAKIRKDSLELEKLETENSEIEKLNKERWNLIKKLERLGVDFKDHTFKLVK